MHTFGMNAFVPEGCILPNKFTKKKLINLEYLHLPNIIGRNLLEILEGYIHSGRIHTFGMNAFIPEYFFMIYKN